MYGISVDLITFDLGLPLKVKSNIFEFLMGCIFWIGHVMTQFYMKHIEEVIYMYNGLSVDLMIFELDDLWPWMTLKCQIGNYGSDFEQYLNKFHFC